MQRWLLGAFSCAFLACARGEATAPSNEVSGCIDQDQDGRGVYCVGGTDCDDSNAQLHQLLRGYPDQDQDGHGHGVAVQICSGATLPAGYAADNLDCDDLDPTLWDTCVGCVDNDGDTYGTNCAAGDDCDDSTAQLFQLLEGYVDADSDGHGTGAALELCSGDNLPAGYAADTLDCDDGDDTVWQNCTPPDPDLIHFDSFGYVVDRDVENNTPTGPNVFLDHGWSGVKDMRVSFPGAGGYLYTVDAIPGYDGTVPGSSGRVLVIESNVSTTQDEAGYGQTDFYLQYGDGNDGDIPADVWFQFWTYTNDSGSQQSDFARNNKFLYPTNTGYPSDSLPWLVSFGTAQHEIGDGETGELGYGPDAAFSNRPPGADYLLASEYPTNRDKLGSNRVGTDGANLANTWYLTKFHIDTSGQQGAYEVWQREMGNQTWTKTTEWIGGETTSFSWPTAEESRVGARYLRMPTTWGVYADATTSFDAWLYMADFAMATGESALPTYDSY